VPPDWVLSTLISIRFMAQRPSQSLGLCCRPGRQRKFMAVVTAHPRAMHSNLATMETNLAVGPAPAVNNAASAMMMWRAGEFPRLLAKHLLDGSAW
jgi:hypothetical protein